MTRTHINPPPPHADPPLHTGTSSLTVTASFDPELMMRKKTSGALGWSAGRMMDSTSEASTLPGSAYTDLRTWGNKKQTKKRQESELSTLRRWRDTLPGSAYTDLGTCMGQHKRSITGAGSAYTDVRTLVSAREAIKRASSVRFEGGTSRGRALGVHRREDLRSAKTYKGHAFSTP